MYTCSIVFFSLCGFMSYLKHGQGKHAPLCSLKPASSIPNIYQKYQHWNKTVNRIAVRGDPFKHFPCTYQESNQRSTIHRKEFTHVDIFFRDRHLFQFELFYHFFFNFNHWVDGYKLQYYVEIRWRQDFICSFYVFAFHSINRYIFSINILVFMVLCIWHVFNINDYNEYKD